MLINEGSLDTPDSMDGILQGAAVISPPVTTGGSETLMYCTLPLGVGEMTLPGQTATRLDWKQFQTSPRLRLALLDANGVPLNLTGAQAVTLRLLPVLGGTVSVSEVMTVDYAAGGQVSYALQAADVALAGSFHLEIEVVIADGSLMYFPSDGYVVFVIHPSLGM